MSSYIILAVGIAVFVVLVVYTLYVRRENNKDYAQMHLHAPLVVPENLNREEEAVKYVYRTSAECGMSPLYCLRMSV